MKRTLLYGKVGNSKSYPWYDGFQINADGSIDLRLSGLNALDIEAGDDEIRWIDVFKSQLNNILSPQEMLEASLSMNLNSLEVYDKYFARLWDRLYEYCDTPAEKEFFNLYCHLCLRHNDTDALLPALLPQVYINWYATKEKRIDTEPYKVDFVFKSPEFRTNNLVVVEIDGLSHYADFDNYTGKYTVDEVIYGKHLKKDRWLRKQGFQVFRIGNSEIKSIANLPKEEKLREFYFFFREVFGGIIAIDAFHPYF